MALQKTEYVNNQTVITAEQMNAIQDAIIDNENRINNMTHEGSLPTDPTFESVNVQPSEDDGVNLTGYMEGDTPVLEIRGTRGDEFVRVFGLVDPTEPSDVATKKYVDETVASNGSSTEAEIYVGSEPPQGSTPVLWIDPEGGSGDSGSSDFTLIDTFTLTEDVSSVYRELGAEYKAVKICFTDLGASADTSQKYDTWLTVNSNGYTSTKATKLTGGGENIACGTQLGKASGVIELSFFDEFMIGEFRGMYVGTKSASCYFANKISVVGNNVHSFTLHLGNAQIASGLTMRIYGVK